MSLVYDPNAPATIADPYPVYERLREEDPVHWSEAVNAWVVSRYEDVVQLLRNDRFSADRTQSENFPEAERGIPLSMLFADPPDHTRLRTLVNKAFTPRTVRSLEPRIERITDDLLDRAAERGHMDAIADFAYPLPITVIAEMLGVPEKDHVRFHEWSEAIAIALGPLSPEPATNKATEARFALAVYFADIIAERRAEPRDDLISELVRAEAGGDVLTEGELIVMCILLLIAGHETTVNLIGNGLWALLRDEQALKHFRTDDTIATTAVEELLRYDSPVQFTGRVLTDDTELHGRPLRRHQAVIGLLASGNRDPRRFEFPDALDLTRTNNQHLSFGAGIHFCLGAQLARVEGRVALSRLVRRFPRLTPLTNDPRWRPAPVLRGLQELPVGLDA